MIETWSPDWSNAVFSTAERDRRWARVRELMDRDGLDAIVCLPCSNSHNRGGADALYLTQLGENSDETAVYFPIEGEPTAWLSRGGVWPSSNWFTDIRAASRGTGGQAIVDRLKEAGFTDGKIAIAGLTGGVLAHCREAEGEANWQSVESVRKAFPEAGVVSGTDLLGEARYVKGDEEVGFLRKGTQLAEKVLDTVKQHARIGVRERHVFAQMMYTSAREGGSFTPMFGWISGPAGNPYHRVEQPSFRSFEAGDVLAVEFDGRWGGYIAQIDQTFTFGPAGRDTMDSMELTLEAFQRVLERMKPGVTAGELMDAARVTGLNGRAVVNLGMHGRGTGDDGPLITPNVTPEAKRAEMLEGAVMCVKPGATLDGKPYGANFGETVVVTREGGVRLGTRRLELCELL